MRGETGHWETRRQPEQCQTKLVNLRDQQRNKKKGNETKQEMKLPARNREIKSDRGTGRWETRGQSEQCQMEQS